MSVRAAILAASLSAAAGCAHVQAPPGGPDDRDPPTVVATRPVDRTVDPSIRGPVVLLFNERVSERGVDRAVQVSPRTSGVVVRHSGDEIRVQLREGWRPNTIYHITLMPGLQDLFNNRTTAATRLVFSTGGEIPETMLRGSVVDRVTVEPAREHRVEAILRPDSLVYATATDSAGRFEIANIPPGDYLVRVFEDMNSNRELDPFEPRDSAQAMVSTEPAEANFSVVLPDSTAPRVASARVEGRVVTVTFDDYLDPAATPTPGDVTITGAAGERIAVLRTAVGELPATDTTAVGDTLPVTPVDTAAAPPSDTGTIRTTEPAQRPARELRIELASEPSLVPGAEYQVGVRGVTNVVGLSTDVTATFTAPEPAIEEAPPPDGVPSADNPNRIE